MKLNIDDCKTSAQSVTKVGYTESTRNLNFRIECNDLNDLKECVEIIKSYNEFDYQIVNEELMHYANFKKYYNSDDPNNGSDLLKYDIGREGSVVMYIKLLDSTPIQYIAEDGSVKDFTRELFEKNMKTFSKVAKADECDIEEDGAYITCRLWWD